MCNANPMSGFGLFGGKGGAGTTDFRARAPVNTFNASTYGIGGPGAAPQNQFRAQSATMPADPTGRTIGQQQGFADTLRAQMAGGGPSLAQLQLQKATQQNAQNAASQIGSVRGINPAMAARGIASAAAGANQDAALGSAMVRNAEQLQAQQQLGNVLNQMGGLQLGEQGLQTQFALGNTQQQNQYNAAAAGQNAAMQLANQQLGQQAQIANQQNYLDTQRVNAGVAGQNAGLNLGAQGINAGIAMGNAKAKGDMFGGLLNGGMAAMGLMLNEGGEVPEYDDGGVIEDVSGPPPQPVYVPDYTQGQSGGRGVADAMMNFGKMYFARGAAAQGESPLPLAAVPAAQSVPGGFAGGGNVPADVDLGPKKDVELPATDPRYQLPVYRGENAKKAKEEAERKEGKPEQLAKAPGFSDGGKIPRDADLGKKKEVELPASDPLYQLPVYRGENAKRAQEEAERQRQLATQERFAQQLALGGVSGAPWQGIRGGEVPGEPMVYADTPTNDTVPAKLTPGEIVLPLSVTEAPDAPARAADFVSMLKGRERARGFCSGGVSKKAS